MTLKYGRVIGTTFSIRRKYKKEALPNWSASFRNLVETMHLSILTQTHMIAYLEYDSYVMYNCIKQLET